MDLLPDPYLPAPYSGRNSEQGPRSKETGLQVKVSSFHIKKTPNSKEKGALMLTSNQGLASVLTTEEITNDNQTVHIRANHFLRIASHDTLTWYERFWIEDCRCSL